MSKNIKLNIANKINLKKTTFLDKTLLYCFITILSLIKITISISREIDFQTIYEQPIEQQIKSNFYMSLLGGASIGKFSLEIKNLTCPWQTKSSEVKRKINKFNMPFEFYNQTFTDNQYILDEDSLPGVGYKLEFYIPSKNIHRYGENPTPVNYLTDYTYMQGETPYTHSVQFATPLNGLCDKGIRLFYPRNITQAADYNKYNKSIIILEDKINMLYGFTLETQLVFVNVIEEYYTKLPTKEYFFMDEEKKCFTFSVVLNNKNNDFFQNLYENQNSYSSTFVSELYKIPKSLIIEFVYNVDYYNSSVDKKNIWINIFSINDDLSPTFHVKNRNTFIEQHNFYENITISYERFYHMIPEECKISDFLVLQNLENINRKGYWKQEDKKEFSVDSVLKIKFKNKLQLCLIIELSNFIDLDTVFKPSISIDPVTEVETSIYDGKSSGYGRIALMSFMCRTLTTQLLYLRKIKYYSTELDVEPNDNASSIKGKIVCGNNLDDSNTYNNAYLPPENEGRLEIVNISKNYNEYIKLLYSTGNSKISPQYTKFNFIEAACVPRSFYIYPGKMNPYFERKSVLVSFPLIGSNRKFIDFYLWVSNSFGTKVVINDFLNLQKMSSLLKPYPEEMYRICVNSQSNNIQVGFCNCSLCERIMNLQLSYSNFRTHQTCLNNFTSKCFCFDVSRADAKENKIYYKQFDICTECKFDSHCRFSLANAKCQDPDVKLKTLFPESYFLPNPLVKKLDLELYSNDDSRDFGRVVDGLIKANKCDCMDYSTKIFESVNGNTYKYRVYGKKPPVNESFNYALQICFSCLTNNIRSEDFCRLNDCVYFSDPDNFIQTYTYPYGGPNCNKCYYAGEYIQFVKYTDNFFYNKIKSCIENNKFNNILLACRELANQYKYDISQLLSGIVTHFNIECPARRIDQFVNTNDSICAPWLGFANNLNVGLLGKKHTLDSADSGVPLFEKELQCMDPNCEPSTKQNCVDNNLECVCYDSCPLGQQENYVNEISAQQNQNNIVVTVMVPCSGRGICTSNRGCLCDYGFLKPNCQLHCSETLGGCCYSDLDCGKNIDNGRVKCKIEYGYLGYCDLI